MRTHIGMNLAFAAIAFLAAFAANGNADPPWTSGGGNTNNITIGINMGGGCCCSDSGQMGMGAGGQAGAGAGRRGRLPHGVQRGHAGF